MESYGIGAFKAALKKARALAGLSYRELGRRSGIHWTLAYRVETNAHHEPSITTVARLARGLGVEFRCSERGWSTGPVGEAEELRNGLALARDAIKALWLEACLIGDMCGQGIGDETRAMCESVIGERLSDEPWEEG